MKTGAIAFVDALGFKGIWRKYDAPLVIAGLRRLAEVGQAREYLTHIFQAVDGLTIDTVPRRMRIRLLSDTFIVGVLVRGVRS